MNLGETNFEDGIAFPGLFLQEFPESYVAGELRDGYGTCGWRSSPCVARSVALFVEAARGSRWEPGRVLEVGNEIVVREEKPPRRCQKRQL